MSLHKVIDVPLCKKEYGSLSQSVLFSSVVAESNVLRHFKSAYYTISLLHARVNFRTVYMSINNAWK